MQQYTSWKDPQPIIIRPYPEPQWERLTPYYPCPWCKTSYIPEGNVLSCPMCGGPGEDDMPKLIMSLTPDVDWTQPGGVVRIPPGVRKPPPPEEGYYPHPETLRNWRF